MEYLWGGSVHVIAAIICAKWAMELGFNQFRQILWGIAGLVLPPIILLVLYTRLIAKNGAAPVAA